MHRHFFAALHPTVHFRTEPATGDPPAETPPAAPPAETPPAAPPAAPPAPKTNHDAAAQRIIDREKARADKAEEKLRKAQEAQETKEQKLQRERDEAIAKSTASDERADKAEVRSKIRVIATGKAAKPEAVVALSADKLLDLKDATDDELAAHVDNLITTYGIQAAGAEPPRPPGAGTPGTGTQGGTAPGTPGGLGGPEATGDPTKDYRAGIGRGLLGLLGGGQARPPIDEE